MAGASNRPGGGSLRGVCIGVVLGIVALVPAIALARAGATDPLATRLVDAVMGAVAAVGWVVVPQLLLAVFIFGLAVHRVAASGAGLGAPTSPSWLGPAVESALLLGMLGTIAGMVRGFSGLDPQALEPGPLIHSLGAALRSSFVGFGIALVGVWLGPQAAPEPGTRPEPDHGTRPETDGGTA